MHTTPMNGMRRVKSWAEIVGIAFVYALGLLLLKFLVRPLLFGSPAIKGDEVEDSVLWFVLVIVVLALERAAAKPWNVKQQINQDRDSNV